MSQTEDVTKICIGCRNEQELTQFFKLKSSPDGHHKYCKGCCKVNRALENVRKRDKSSKISIRQTYRAKQLGIHFETDVLLVNIYKKDRGVCARCKKWVQPKHASMDHIQPLSKGGEHTKDNTQLMHLTCNLRKGNRE